MMLVPLALGLLIGAAAPAPASLAAPPALVAAAPTLPSSVGLLPARLSRRLSTTRVERGASFLGARVTLAPRTAWAPLHRLPGHRTTTRHLATREGRGPPIAL